jgi:hypothetical protein
MVDITIVESLRQLLTHFTTIPESPEEEAKGEIPDPTPFFSCTEDDSYAAYDLLKVTGLSEVEQKMFSFLDMVRGTIQRYRVSGQLWHLFGDTHDAQLVRIELDPLRTRGQLGVARFRISDLIQMGTNYNRDWAMGWVEKLTNMPQGTMVLQFVDKEFSNRYGVPFVISSNETRQ